MPFAVVLTRPSCYFYLRLSRLRAWKGVSGNALCPVAMLRYIANLQAPNALRQGIPALLYERSPASASLHYHCPSLSFILECRWQNGQRLYLPRASAYSGDAS